MPERVFSYGANHEGIKLSVILESDSKFPNIQIEAIRGSHINLGLEGNIRAEPNGAWASLDLKTVEELAEVLLVILEMSK